MNFHSRDYNHKPMNMSPSQVSSELSILFYSLSTKAKKMPHPTEGTNLGRLLLCMEAPANGFMRHQPSLNRPGTQEWEKLKAGLNPIIDRPIIEISTMKKE
jgi:hypothetical protein